MPVIARVEHGLSDALQEQGATSNLDEKERLWSGLEREACVVMVAHAGSLAAVMSYLLGVRQAPWAWRRFGLSHCGIARLKSFSAAGGRAFGLRTFDDLSHLGPDARSR
jgi:broad specificity phosphatase PhoE